MSLEEDEREHCERVANEMLHDAMLNAGNPIDTLIRERALAREHASTLLKASLDHAIEHGAKAWGELSEARAKLAAEESAHADTLRVLAHGARQMAAVEALCANKDGDERWSVLVSELRNILGGEP